MKIIPNRPLIFNCQRNPRVMRILSLSGSKTGSVLVETSLLVKFLTIYSVCPKKVTCVQMPQGAKKKTTTTTTTITCTKCRAKTECIMGDLKITKI